MFPLKVLPGSSGDEHDIFSLTSTVVTAIVQDKLPLDKSSATAMGSGSGEESTAVK
jgi:hypothetical protein